MCRLEQVSIPKIGVTSYYLYFCVFLINIYNFRYFFRPKLTETNLITLRFKAVKTQGCDIVENE